MKPAPFAYHAPSSVDEALTLLAELGPNAKVLAGGQSLMPLMNMRLARPSHVIDINCLAEMSFIRPTDDGGLTIGSLARHRAVEQSSEVAVRAPLLREATPLIGDRQIRCRGTVGGSLAHADPVAEIPTVMAALDAELVVGARGASRTVAASEFFFGPMTTALEADELLQEIRVPPPPPQAGHAFLELVRQRGAFALVSAAAVIALEDDRVSHARLCLGGVGPTPVRARRAEAELDGRRPTADLLSSAARLAASDTDPEADVHVSADYRREMAEVYARRALELAVSRARGIPR